MDAENTQPATSTAESFLGRIPEEMATAPPKPSLVDAAGLQKTLEGLTNMALAHEIALNRDFKLSKPDLSVEPVSPEVEFALAAKEKYWEQVDNILLCKDIKSSKDIILELLQTLKSMLHSTLLPHNVTIRNKINQELDEKTILTHIERDAFDFEYYMEFVLNTLASVCCPVRDQEILNVRKITHPSTKVRQVMELMENMNLDMANFIISQSRNTIVQHCVVYERNKFADYIDIQYQMQNDPLRITRDWVMRHKKVDASFDETMAAAFTEVMEGGTKQWPETLALDWARFPQIREEILRVTIIAAMVALVHECAQPKFLLSPEKAKDLEKAARTVLKNQELVLKLRNELNVLVTCDEVANPEKFKEALERCAVQSIQVVEGHAKVEFCLSGLEEFHKEKIKSLLRPLIGMNHPVRFFYERRVKEWFTELVKKGGTSLTDCPHTLNNVAALITPPVTEMLRLSIYNREIFDVLYLEIFTDKCPQPTFVVDSETGLKDQHIKDIIAKLQGLTEKNTIYRPAPVNAKTGVSHDSKGKTIFDTESQSFSDPPKLSRLEQIIKEPTLAEDIVGPEVELRKCDSQSDNLITRPHQADISITRNLPNVNDNKKIDLPLPPTSVPTNMLPKPTKALEETPLPCTEPGFKCGVPPDPQEPDPNEKTIGEVFLPSLPIKRDVSDPTITEAPTSPPPPSPK